MLTRSFLQTCSMYYVAKALIGQLPTSLDPEKEQIEQARTKAVANLQRIRRTEDGDRDVSGGYKEDSASGREREELTLNQYESQIAMEVVAPEDIPVGFDGM